MAFTMSAERAGLSAAFAAVAKIANPKLAPAFGFVHANAADDTLELTASDGELTMSTSTPVSVTADSDDDVAGLIPKVAVDYLVKLPDGPVSIKVDNDAVVVTADRRSASFATMKPSEFPTVSVPDADPVVLDAAMLANAIEGTRFAASTNRADRPMLAGVLFESTDDDAVNVVSTDSYRLAVKTLSTDAFGSEAKVLVPASTLAQVQRFLGSAGKVEFSASDTNAMFKVGDVTFVTQLISGDYPNWSAAMPQKPSTSFDVDVAELTAAIGRLNLLASSGQNCIGFEQVNVDGTDVLELTVDGADVGQATEQVDAVFHGDVSEFALNGSFLLQALDVLDGSVNFAARSEVLGVYVTSESDPNLRILQMPVRRA